MSSLLYPHPTMPGRPRIKITKLCVEHQDKTTTLSNAALGALLDEDDLYLDATLLEYDKWTRLELSMEVHLAGMRPESLSENDAARSLVFALDCPTTHLRASFIGHQSEADASTWFGKAEIQRLEVAELVHLRGIFVTTVTNRNHRFLGETPSLTISLSKASSVAKHGMLPVKWADFRTDEDRHFLRDFELEPYYFDLTDVVPTLYLNSSFEGLPELFPGDGRPARAWRPLHESERISIAKGVWLAMFHSAIDQVVQVEDDEPDWPTVEWQRSVLRRLLPYLFPELASDPASMLSAAVSQANDDAGRRQLVSLAHGVIGRNILQEGKSLRRAIQDVAKVSEDHTSD